MGQDEIVNWLRQKRLEGDAGFHSVLDIKAGLRQSGLGNGFRIYEQCVQLWRFGILEIRREGLLIKGYRLRKKYVGIVEEL